jgi:hypothetical protein
VLGGGTLRAGHTEAWPTRGLGPLRALHTMGIPRSFPKKRKQVSVYSPCLSRTSSHSWITVIITTMSSDLILAQMASGHIIATTTLDTVITFVITFVAPLTSSRVIWHKVHIWSFSVLLSVHFSILVPLIYRPTRSVQ